jgi:hypothetical protein
LPGYDTKVYVWVKATPVEVIWGDG